MKSHKDLLAWQKSVDMVTRVYSETNGWPKEEIYGLTSQIRRAAVSIPSNIAEGAGRAGKKEFSRFLSSLGGCPTIRAVAKIWWFETRFWLI